MLEGSSRSHLVQPPAQSKSNQSRLFRDFSSQVSNTCKVGDTIASLSNPFQQQLKLAIFPVIYEKFPASNLCLLPLVLSRSDLKHKCFRIGLQNLGLDCSHSQQFSNSFSSCEEAPVFIRLRGHSVQAVLYTGCGMLYLHPLTLLGGHSVVDAQVIYLVSHTPRDVNS